MTIFVRSDPSASWFAAGPTRESNRERRIAALRSAVAGNRYRVNAEAIASSLIAAIAAHAGLAAPHH